MSAQAKGPADDRASRQAATTEARWNRNTADRHEMRMRQMADRICRLEQGERHWWITAVDSDRSCCPKCRRQEWAEESA